MQINEAGLLPRFSLSPQKIFLTVIPSISEESQKAKQKDIRLRGYDGENAEIPNSETVGALHATPLQYLRVYARVPHHSERSEKSQKIHSLEGGEAEMTKNLCC